MSEKKIIKMTKYGDTRLPHDSDTLLIILIYLYLRDIFEAGLRMESFYIAILLVFNSRITASVYCVQRCMHRFKQTQHTFSHESKNAIKKRKKKRAINLKS